MKLLKEEKEEEGESQEIAQESEVQISEVGGTD